MRLLLWLILQIIWLTGLNPASPRLYSHNEAARWNHEQGVYLAREGKLHAAVQLLKKSVEHQPESDAWFDLGSVMLEIGDAQTDYVLHRAWKVSSIYKKQIKSMMELSSVSANLRRAHNATNPINVLRHLAQALWIHPNSPTVLSKVDSACQELAGGKYLHLWNELQADLMTESKVAVREQRFWKAVKTMELACICEIQPAANDGISTSRLPLLAETAIATLRFRVLLQLGSLLLNLAIQQPGLASTFNRGVQGINGPGASASVNSILRAHDIIQTLKDAVRAHCKNISGSEYAATMNKGCRTKQKALKHAQRALTKILDDHNFVISELRENIELYIRTREWWQGNQSGEFAKQVESHPSGEHVAESLVDWVSMHGGSVSPNVNIQLLPSRGYGLVAVREFQPSPILQLPTQLVMSQVSALRMGLRPVLHNRFYTDSELGLNAILIIHILIELAKGPSSFYFPYLQYLEKTQPARTFTLDFAVKLEYIRTEAKDLNDSDATADAILTRQLSLEKKMAQQSPFVREVFASHARTIIRAHTKIFPRIFHEYPSLFTEVLTRRIIDQASEGSINDPFSLEHFTMVCHWIRSRHFSWPKRYLLGDADHTDSHHVETANDVPLLDLNGKYSDVGVVEKNHNCHSQGPGLCERDDISQNTQGSHDEMLIVMLPILDLVNHGSDANYSCLGAGNILFSQQRDPLNLSNMGVTRFVAHLHSTKSAQPGDEVRFAYRCPAICSDFMQIYYDFTDHSTSQQCDPSIISRRLDFFP